jgi:predicted DNA binding CopG/RHH family protein
MSHTKITVRIKNTLLDALSVRAGEMGLSRNALISSVLHAFTKREDVLRSVEPADDN